jgi:methylaspartate ammonia-lyase
MATATNVMYEAVKAQFTAQKQKAIAQLTVYLTNPVGIGEHPDLIDEMVKLTRDLADAQGCIDILNETFETKVNDNSRDSSETA